MIWFYFVEEKANLKNMSLDLIKNLKLSMAFRSGMHNAIMPEKMCILNRLANRKKWLLSLGCLGYFPTEWLH